MLTSIHLSYVLGDIPFEERFTVAKKLGFNAVEYPFPYEIPAKQYADLLLTNGLSQISIGAPACNYKAGEPGFSITPSLKSEFDRSIDTVIKYAKVIDCTNVHIFAGPRAAGVSEELAFETYCSRVAEAHDRLHREGLNVVLEAVNSRDFKGYFIDRLSTLLRALATIDRPNVKIIMDIYHARVNDEDPIDFILKHSGRIAHVQLADYPGRHEPGTGIIDFNSVFEALKRSKYSGSIGLEYVPTRPVSEGVPLVNELCLAATRA
jgi:hydroxypyruvate isomerase